MTANFRNLSEAHDLVDSLNEQIATLSAENAQLKAAPPKTIAPTPPAAPPRSAAPAPAAAKPTAPAAPAAPTSSTAMIINPRPAPTTELERLRSQLEVAAPEQRASLYKQIKALENDTSMRAFKAARRK